MIGPHSAAALMHRTERHCLPVACHIKYDATKLNIESSLHPQQVATESGNSRVHVWAVQAHLEDSRMCEASREEASLAQQALYERANIQSICLVVADQQQGAVQGNPPTPPLHPPILARGQEHRALKRLQVVQCPEVCNNAIDITAT